MTLRGETGRFGLVAVTVETKAKIKQLSSEASMPAYKWVAQLVDQAAAGGQGALPGIRSVKPRTDTDDFDDAFARLALKLLGALGVTLKRGPVDDEDLDDVERSVRTLRQRLHSREIPGIGSMQLEG